MTVIGVVLTAIALGLIAYEALVAVSILRHDPPRERPNPKTRAGQLVQEMRRPVTWVLVAAAGAALSAFIADAVSAESDRETGEAMERLAMALLLIVDVLAVYITTVVAIAIWKAARRLDVTGQLTSVVPRWTLTHPVALVTSWVAVGLSPAIVVLRLAEGLAE